MQVNSNIRVTITTWLCWVFKAGPQLVWFVCGWDGNDHRFDSVCAADQACALVGWVLLWAEWHAAEDLPVRHGHHAFGEHSVQLGLVRLLHQVPQPRIQVARHSLHVQTAAYWRNRSTNLRLKRRGTGLPGLVDPQLGSYLLALSLLSRLHDSWRVFRQEDLIKISREKRSAVNNRKTPNFNL